MLPYLTLLYVLFFFIIVGMAGFLCDYVTEREIFFGNYRENERGN